MSNVIVRSKTVNVYCSAEARILNGGAGDLNVGGSVNGGTNNCGNGNNANKVDGNMFANNPFFNKMNLILLYKNPNHNGLGLMNL